MKTKMTPDEEYTFLNKHLTILGNPRSLQHQKSIKTLLDEFFDAEESITTNEELDYQDAYEAFMAVLLCIFSVARDEEEYEIMGKVERAYYLQHNIVMGFIMNYYTNKQDKEHNLEWLALSDEYFQDQIQDILKKHK